MLLDAGERQTLPAILENRQWREREQRKLAERFPGCCVVSVKMNIPGAVKTNDGIRAMFSTGMEEFGRQLSERGIELVEYHVYMKRATGPEAFMVLDGGSLTVKMEAIAFEDDYVIGRLFDADVMTAASQDQLSRSSLGIDPRECLVCEKPAKVCARAQAHNVWQIGNAVDGYFRQYRDMVRETQCETVG